METRELRKKLAGIGLAGLLAGAGLVAGPAMAAASG